MTKKKRALYDEFGEVSLQQGFDEQRARMMREYQRQGGMPGGGRGQGGIPGFDPADFTGAAGAGGADFSDLLGDLFGRVRGGGFGGASGPSGASGPPGTAGRGRSRKGPDMEGTVAVDFVDAIRGTTVNLQRGPDNVAVRIPAGAKDGSRLRVPGQGGRAAGVGEAGDLFLTVQVRPHAHFTRDGDDLRVTVPLRVGEAYNGAKVQVPTPHGAVTLKVNPGTSSGTTTRLKGKGLHRPGKPEGDLYVTFAIVLPPAGDGELGKAAAAFDAKTNDPRAALVF